MKYRNCQTKEIITENELFDMFDESINDAFGDVEVAGQKYPTADVLRAADPVAYRGLIADLLDESGWDEYPTWVEDVHRVTERECHVDFYSWNEEYGGKLLTPVDVYDIAEMGPEEAAGCYGWDLDTAERAIRWAAGYVSRIEAAREDINVLLEHILQTTDRREIVALIQKIGAIEKDFGDDHLARELRETIKN